MSCAPNVAPAISVNTKHFNILHFASGTKMDETNYYDSSELSQVNSSQLSLYYTPMTTPIKISTIENDGNNEVEEDDDDEILSSVLSTQLNFTDENDNVTISETHYSNDQQSDTSIESLSTLVPGIELTSPKQNEIQLLECMEMENGFGGILLGELEKIEHLEKQITTIGIHLKEMRENILRLYRNCPQLIGERKYCKQPIMKNDVSTQTSDLPLSIEDNQLVEIGNTRMQTQTQGGRPNSIASTNTSTIITNFDPFDLDEHIKYKLRRLPALVKGFLIRRLLRTERVCRLKQTIADTSTILVQFKLNLLHEGQLTVTHQDVLFHQRLCIQLENTCKEFYSIFFHMNKAKQMEMIAQHREYLKTANYLKVKRSSSVQSETSSSNSNSSRLYKVY